MSTTAEKLWEAKRTLPEPLLAEVLDFAEFLRIKRGGVEAGYQIEQKVDLIVSRGRIIIQPAERVEYDLEALIGGINEENRHDEINLGSPIGKETQCDICITLS